MDSVQNDMEHLYKALQRKTKGIEKKMKKNSSFFIVQFGRAVTLFFLYVVEVFLMSAYTLFFPSAKSFGRLHQLGKHGHYTKSYSQHRSWKHKMQVTSVASIAVMAAVVVMNIVFVSGVPTYAAVESFTCSGTSGTPTAITEADYVGDDLTLSPTDASGPYYCEIDADLSVASLTIEDGVILVHPAEDTNGIDITTTGNLTIEADGGDADSDPAMISAKGLGCPGGNSGGTAGEGPDPAASNTCAVSETGFGPYAYWGGGGAAHGGAGGDGANNSAADGSLVTYGDQHAPTLLGSGGAGAANSAGGAGGGIIRLNVGGTLDVDGQITADGASGGNGGSVGGGGGSGGSVYITTDTLDGSGSISANGGGDGNVANTNDGGAGGGGRVALFYDSLSAYTITNTTAAKGEISGSGTAAGNGSTFILDRTTDDGSGTLSITSGLELQDGEDYSRTNLQFGNGAEITCAAQDTLTLSATDDFTDVGSVFNCTNTITTKIDIDVTDTFTTTDVDWDITDAPAVDITAATWTSSGTSTIDITKADADIPLDITNDLVWNGMSFSCGGGSTSGDGGGLTVNGISWTLQSSSTLTCNIHATSMTNITVDDTSVLSANGMGCAGGTNADNGYGPDTGNSDVCTQSTAGAGTGGTYTASGGAHGGYGGAGDGAGGAVPAKDRNNNTYGTSTAPTLLGSGGGAGQSSAGGAGGGIVRLDLSGTLLLDGNISANGGDAPDGNANQAGAGGSGGSVYITGNVLDCDGTGSCSSSPSITAAGGNGDDANNGDGGGGGGGIVYVKYSTDSDSVLSASMSASGGEAAEGNTPGHANAEDGGAGVTGSGLNAVPSTPSVTSPSNAATGVDRNAPVTTSAFSGDLAHSSSDFQISDDNTFSDADCSDTNIVWCKLDDTSNTSSTTVNSSNGTFANALSGTGLLAPDTTYYVRTRHTSGAGDSSWSSAISFTTATNTAPSAPTHSAPSNGATSQSITPTLTTGSFSDGDSDTHVDSDWLLYESSDCSGTAVWSTLGDNSNKTSVVVNDTNGSFADTHASQTDLKGHTTFSFKTLQNDGYDDSSYSTCTSFTTTNATPVLDSNVSDQSLTEDTDVTGAFDLDDVVSDTDWNDDDAYNCTASDDLDALLGTMTINNDRTVDFDLSDNAVGSDTVQIDCEDGGSASVATNSITVTVANVNDAPTKDNNISDVSLAEDTDSSAAFDLDDFFSDVDTGDTCTYSVVDTWADGDVTINNDGTVDFSPSADTTGSDTVSFRCTDGSNATVDSNSVTVNISAVNDAPTISGVVDVTIDEGQALAVVAQGVDVEGNTLSFTAQDDDGSFSAKGYTVSDLFTDNGNNTGTFEWTPGYTDTGDYALGFTVSDGSQSSSTSITITVDPANSVPTFDGSLPNIAMTSGKTSTAVFDLDKYFEDLDEETLTYTVVGNDKVTASFDEGAVTLTAASGFSGSESLIFRGTDAEGESAISNTVVVTVAAGVKLKDVDYVKGKSKGKGKVRVYNDKGKVIAKWKAFTKGGVVPRIAELNNKGYVFTVKRRSGSTIHAYNITGGKAVKKQRLSKKLHWRRLATGNLDSEKDTEEVVVVTERGSTLYFKVLSFKPKKKRFVVEKRSKYRSKLLSDKKYSVSVEKKQVKLYDDNGSLLFIWTPFSTETTNILN